jgi:HAD superfamily hydrolase (TIGR01509 family)
MDGVLVDTEKVHQAARAAVYRRYSLPIEKLKDIPVAGRNTETIFSEVHRICPFPVPVEQAIAEKREVFVTMLKTDLSPLPGAADLLRQYRGRLRMALVSASARTNVDAILRITGFSAYFDRVIYADDVRRFKPDPEAYVLAAGRIGVSLPACVVFEDSGVGVRAGKRAGARVVGVRTGYGDQDLREADLVVENLAAGLAAVTRFIGT